ncbi:MAG: helix-turn-helix transcriptional regulator [Clostridia bacterium]|nr:helix-turn-helix transcriptional regulator [Clostridia bacterium]
MQLRLREIRKEKQITQQALAQQVGVSQGFLSDVENGQCSPGLDVFIRIASALGCSLDNLAGTDNILPNSEG